MNRSTQNDSCDYEGEFYRVLSEGLEGEKLASADDLMDVRRGTHAKLSADGSVALLMVMTPEASTWLTERLAHIEHHACKKSLPAAIGLMRLVVQELGSVE